MVAENSDRDTEGIKAKIRERQNSYFKFRHTPDDSLIGYMMMLNKELEERSRQTEKHNEKFWYQDAASLILEVLLRYDELKSYKEMKEHDTYRGRELPRFSER